MAEPVDVSPAKGKAATVHVMTPPPAKRLKQAVLPFKALSTKPVTENVTNDPNSGNSIKKRKLSDDNSSPIKAPKTPQSEDAKASKKSTDTENEVSSSSEPEAKHKNEAKVTKAKVVGLLDKFIQSAQQQVVSTSSNDEVIDLVEEENQCQRKSDISNEEDKDEASETTNDKNEDSVLDKTNESVQAEGSECGSQNEQDDTKDAAIDSNLLTPNASKSSIKKAPGSKKKTPRMSKEEKEKLLKEKEDRRQLEKEEKERLKQEKKEERERKAKEEKEKKEKEKEEKRKKMEEEKQAKLEEKQQEEEEKKCQKEEERKRKAEEKRIELEKKKLEAEKLKEQKEAERFKEEAAKKQVSQVQKSLMKNFFIQKQKLETKIQKEKAEGNGLFMPFQVKSGMRLAPTVRVSRDNLMLQLEKFEPYFKSQDCEVLYLDELKKKPTPKLKGAELKTFPFDDDDCMTLDEDFQHKKKERIRAKLLQFHENYRPAFYGTWRKQSKDITGRNPFGQDKAILDYEVDSDEEWEEEEPGESLSDADNNNEDEDEEVDDEEEEDGFFVPHGYLSDGEGYEDHEEDVTPEQLKARQLAKARAFEGDLNKKTEVLKSIIVGCYWQDQTIDLVPQVLEQFTMVKLAAQNPIEMVQQPIETPSRIEKTKNEKKTSKGVKRAILQQVPDEAFPDLIRLVNGNSKGLPKLIREFREYWRLKETGSKGKDDISAIEEDALNEDDATDDAVNKTKEVDSNEKINDSAKLDSEMIDTSVSEGNENAPEGDGKCEKKVYSISKRQLEKTIKEIAVYEKRGDYNKLCWYVNQSVLVKYNLKELPVPTNWQWITMPAPKINDTQNVPSPIGKEIPSGRTTPSQGNPASSGSITKFTVAGITPKVYTPDPMKPKTESPLVRHSITKFFGGQKGTNKLTKKVETSIPLSAEIQIEENGSDENCAIVAIDLKPKKKTA